MVLQHHLQITCVKLYRGHLARINPITCDSLSAIDPKKIADHNPK